MKNILILITFLVSSVSFSQQKSPQLEEFDGLVKATYLFENGTIQQQGFFKDGKLDGKWIAYEENGNKKSIAEYKDGQKTGKWFFWNESSLLEVDYSQNSIAGVKKWSKELIADKN